MRNHAGSHETRWVFVVALVVLVFAGFLSTGPPSPANAIEIQKVPLQKVPLPSGPTAVSPLLKFPDLVVSSVSNPGYAVIGRLIKLTDTTRNNGFGTAIEGTQTRYYLSTDNTAGNNDVPIASRNVTAGLAPSAVNTGTVTVAIPSAMLAGIYYVFACADNTGRVAERYENNNCRFSTTRVKVGKPDLIVSFVSNPPADMRSQDDFEVSDTTRNIGMVPTSQQTVTKYYFSTDLVVGNDVYLGERVVPAGLAVGEESPWTGVFAFPGLAHAQHYLLACSDGGGSEPETNERNNCRFSITTGQGGSM